LRQAIEQQREIYRELQATMRRLEDARAGRG
jgi:hypothetical protein